MQDENSRTPEWLSKVTDRIDRWFSVAATLVIDAMALFSLIALVFSAVAVGFGLWKAIVFYQEQELTNIIVEILTVFIVVEVLAVSVRFLRVNRIEVSDLVDVTLAIIFREIWVGMFSGSLHWQEILALAALVVACGAFRIGLTRESDKNKLLVAPPGGPGA